MTVGFEVAIEESKIHSESNALKHDQMGRGWFEISELVESESQDTVMQPHFGLHKLFRIVAGTLPQIASYLLLITQWNIFT